MREAYRELDCRWCTRRFYVCRSCFRGQAYCGDACAAEGYRAVQDEARARHQASEEGRLDHRDRVRASRALENKAVTDEAASDLALRAKVAPDFEPATSSVDDAALAIEEHADVAAIHAGEGPVARRVGDAMAYRASPSASTDREPAVRCAFCGRIIALQCSGIPPRPG